MPPQEFKCKQCGMCCKEMYGGYNFTVDQEQIDIWEDEAPFLLKWVSEIYDGMYDGWISPYTGEDVYKCPWFCVLKSDKYKNKGPFCKIHKFKPPICKDFPLSYSHGIRTGCKGFNHIHVNAIKQILISELCSCLEQIKETIEIQEESNVNSSRY